MSKRNNDGVDDDDDSTGYIARDGNFISFHKDI